MKISKSSWHYKFYKKNNHFYEPKDLCSYIRNIIYNGFLLIIGIALLTTLGVGYLIGGYEAIMLMFYHIKPNLPDLLAIFAGVTLMVGSIALALFIVKINDNRKYKKWQLAREGYVEEESPSFISLLWKRFKDKTCHLVEIVD